MSFVDDMNYDMDNELNSSNGSGNGAARNTQAACFTCGQTGHKRANCPTTKGRNAQNQNSGRKNQRGSRRGSPNPPQPQQGRDSRMQKHCDNCPHLSNHTTAECKKNNNRNRNTNESKKTELYEVELNYDTVQSLTYCPTCNSTTHGPSTCASKSHSGIIKCEKCGMYGHTRDECQNPVKRRCSNCYMAGNDTNHCKCKTEGISYAHLYFSRRPKAQPGFQFKLPTWNQASGLPPPHSQGPNASRGLIDTPMQTILESPEVRALPGPMTRGRLRSIFQGATVSKTFQGGGLPADIRKHVVAAASLYTASNANRLFHKHEADLVRMGILDWNTIFQAKYLIGQGYTFLREPRAMEAIARGQRPKCRTCGGFGVFLDAKMRTIPSNANVLDLRDFDDWGIFVLFVCGCCTQGFAWV